MAAGTTQHNTTRVYGFLIALTIYLSATRLVLGQDATVAPPGGECEIRFMQGLFRCFTDFKVPFNTYLWAATNGTGGVPPEDEASFSRHMCSVEKDLVKCVLDNLHALVDTPYCQQAEGMDSLLTVQVRTIFEEFDNYCAHECRGTLEASLRACYTDNDIDKSLFLASDGAILGSSLYYVDDFCRKSDKVLTCMKAKVDACPESTYVLKKIGLDPDTFKTGVEFLCQRQEAYVSSLSCFSEQTRTVEKCGEENALTLRRLISRRRAKNSSVTEQQFLQEFCLASVKYVQCDLEAWEAKNTASCDRRALSLKRDLHCQQISAPCLSVVSSEIREVCSSDYGRAAAAQTQKWTWDPDSGVPGASAAASTVARLVLSLPLVAVLTLSP